MAGEWECLELKAKCADLIGQDRRGTPRDDGFHRNFRRDTRKVLRWAVLTTRNGFAVVGKPSASVSVENDNAEVGEKIAILNSRDEVWPLMGYELQSKLAAKA